MPRRAAAPDHAAPAAADVEEPVALAEAELVEDEAVLGVLRLLQRRARVGVARAGVGHRRPEDELVEAVRDVVVVADRTGVAGHRVAQTLGRAAPPRQRLLGGWRGWRQALDPERAGELDGGRGRGSAEAERREVDEQVVGVARVAALDLEVAGDVGPGQAELTGRRREVGRRPRSAQVERPGWVRGPEDGAVVRAQADGDRSVDDTLDDLGDGHLSTLLSWGSWCGPAGVRHRGPPCRRGGAGGTAGPNAA